MQQRRDSEPQVRTRLRRAPALILDALADAESGRRVGAEMQPVAEHSGKRSSTLIMPLAREPKGGANKMSETAKLYCLSGSVMHQPILAGGPGVGERRNLRSYGPGNTFRNS